VQADVRRRQAGLGHAGDHLKRRARERSSVSVET
jgi:hypothetical protein